MDKNTNIEELKNQVIDKINKDYEAAKAAIDKETQKYAELLVKVSKILNDK